jgi:hypothetical protein
MGTAEMEMGIDGTAEQNRISALTDSFSGIWTVFFATIGAIGIIGGTLLALAPAFGGDPGWVSENLRRVGIESGTFLTSGVICIGLALVSLRLKKVNSKLEAAQQTVERTEFLSLSVNQMAERMTILHAELCGLKDSHAAGLRFIQEQSATEAVGMQVDATFRLASSIDQLGARFEARLIEQAQAAQLCFQKLDAAVASQQEQLQDLLTTAENNKVTEQIEITQAGNDEEEEATWPGFDGGHLEAEPLLACGDEFQEIELEVELDDAEGDQAMPDVASYDWEAIRIPEEHRVHDLGLLDQIELDDVAEPLPSHVPQDEHPTVLDLMSEMGTEDLTPIPEPENTETPLTMRIARSEPDSPQKNDRDQGWDTFMDIQ